MSVQTLSRLAGACLLAVFVALPAHVMADEADMQTYYDSEAEPEGMLCTDNMIEEPHSDELEPTLVAHADGCTVPEVPIST